MESNRDGGDSTRQNRKFEPRVTPLEQRVALSGAYAGSIPPDMDLLESQTQVVIAIGTTQIYPGFLLPGNILGDYVNHWGDPVWNLDDIHGSDSGSLVDNPSNPLPDDPIPSPSPTLAPKPAPGPTQSPTSIATGAGAVAPVPTATPAPAPTPSLAPKPVSSVTATITSAVAPAPTPAPAPASLRISSWMEADMAEIATRLRF